MKTKPYIDGQQSNGLQGWSIKSGQRFFKHAVSHHRSNCHRWRETVRPSTTVQELVRAAAWDCDRAWVSSRGPVRICAIRDNLKCAHCGLAICNRQQHLKSTSFGVISTNQYLIGNLNGPHQFLDRCRLQNPAIPPRPPPYRLNRASPCNNSFSV